MRFEETLEDWERLLEACRADRQLRAYLGRELDALDESVRLARESLAKQSRLAREKEATTRVLQQLKKEGEDQNRQVRGGVKAFYGFRSAKLWDFGMTPMRPLGSRKRRGAKEKGERSPGEEGP
jgi:hypothetical protein